MRRPPLLRSRTPFSAPMENTAWTLIRFLPHAENDARSNAKVVLASGTRINFVSGSCFLVSQFRMFRVSSFLEVSPPTEQLMVYFILWNTLLKTLPSATCPTLPSPS